ncbi:MAG: RtcB family protein, partial [Candidatus Binataceae bacterium]
MAAIDAQEGVISPGGVGYDINCGVRLARTHLEFNFVGPRIDRLADALFAKIPAGVGSEGAIPGLSIQELKEVVSEGAEWALRNGYATKRDLEHTEEGGRLAGADPERVSEHAYKRGSKQLGTLGSGNHFLEVSRVDEIYDAKLADALELQLGQVTVLIHSGSRGLGHQTCDDYLKLIGGAMARYEISLPDRQLAAVPICSPEGRAYLGAMA